MPNPPESGSEIPVRYHAPDTGDGGGGGSPETSTSPEELLRDQLISQNNPIAILEKRNEILATPSSDDREKLLQVAEERVDQMMDKLKGKPHLVRQLDANLKKLHDNVFFGGLTEDEVYKLLDDAQNEDVESNFWKLPQNGTLKAEFQGLRGHYYQSGIGQIIDAYHRANGIDNPDWQSRDWMWKPEGGEFPKTTETGFAQAIREIKQIEEDSDVKRMILALDYLRDHRLFEDDSGLQLQLINCFDVDTKLQEKYDVVGRFYDKAVEYTNARPDPDAIIDDAEKRIWYLLKNFTGHLASVLAPDTKVPELLHRLEQLYEEREKKLEHAEKEGWLAGPVDELNILYQEHIRKAFQLEDYIDESDDPPQKLQRPSLEGIIHAQSAIQKARVSLPQEMIKAAAGISGSENLSPEQKQQLNEIRLYVLRRGLDRAEAEIRRANERRLVGQGVILPVRRVNYHRYEWDMSGLEFRLNQIEQVREFDERTKEMNEAEAEREKATLRRIREAYTEEYGVLHILAETPEEMEEFTERWLQLNMVPGVTDVNTVVEKLPAVGNAIAKAWDRILRNPEHNNDENRRKARTMRGEVEGRMIAFAVDWLSGKNKLDAVIQLMKEFSRNAAERISGMNQAFGGRVMLAGAWFETRYANYFFGLNPDNNPNVNDDRARSEYRDRMKKEMIRELAVLGLNKDEDYGGIKLADVAAGENVHRLDDLFTIGGHNQRQAEAAKNLFHALKNGQTDVVDLENRAQQVEVDIDKVKALVELDRLLTKDHGGEKVTQEEKDALKAKGLDYDKEKYNAERAVDTILHLYRALGFEAELNAPRIKISNPDGTYRWTSIEEVVEAEMRRRVEEGVRRSVEEEMRGGTQEEKRRRFQEKMRKYVFPIKPVYNYFLAFDDKTRNEFMREEYGLYEDDEINEYAQARFLLAQAGQIDKDDIDGYEKYLRKNAPKRNDNETKEAYRVRRKRYLDLIPQKLHDIKTNFTGVSADDRNEFKEAIKERLNIMRQSLLGRLRRQLDPEKVLRRIPESGSQEEEQMILLMEKQRDAYFAAFKDVRERCFPSINKERFVVHPAAISTSEWEPHEFELGRPSGQPLDRRKIFYWVEEVLSDPNHFVLKNGTRPLVLHAELYVRPIGIELGVNYRDFSATMEDVKAGRPAAFDNYEIERSYDRIKSADNQRVRFIGGKLKEGTNKGEDPNIVGIFESPLIDTELYEKLKMLSDNYKMTYVEYMDTFKKVFDRAIQISIGFQAYLNDRSKITRASKKAGDIWLDAFYAWVKSKHGQIAYKPTWNEIMDAFKYIKFGEYFSTDPLSESKRRWNK